MRSNSNSTSINNWSSNSNLTSKPRSWKRGSSLFEKQMAGMGFPTEAITRNYSFYLELGIIPFIYEFKRRRRVYSHFKYIKNDQPMVHYIRILQIFMLQNKVPCWLGYIVSVTFTSLNCQEILKKLLLSQI